MKRSDWYIRFPRSEREAFTRWPTSGAAPRRSESNVPFRRSVLDTLISLVKRAIGW